MVQRGVLAYVMIILITIMGLVNFFAPFFSSYKTDPIITYAFIGVAATIAGFKGVAHTFIRRIGNAIVKDTSEEKE